MRSESLSTRLTVSATFLQMWRICESTHPSGQKLAVESALKKLNNALADVEIKQEESNVILEYQSRIKTLSADTGGLASQLNIFPKVVDMVRIDCEKFHGLYKALEESKVSRSNFHRWKQIPDLTVSSFCLIDWCWPGSSSHWHEGIDWTLWWDSWWSHEVWSESLM